MNEQEQFERAYREIEQGAPKLREVLLKLLARNTFEEIAQSQGGVSEGTVRKQSSILYKKFGVKDKTDLLDLFARYKPELRSESKSELTAEMALEFMNRLFIDRDLNLTELERKIFIYFWEVLSYQEISDKMKISSDTIRQSGIKLCKKVSDILGIKIKKSNFKPTIESFWKQSQKGNSRFPIAPQDATQNPTAAPISESISPSTLDRETLLLSNPFIPLTGAIDDPHLFFNRKQEIQRIFEFLESGSSVSLTGDRQIGKSSLLKALERQTDRLNQIGRQPIYLNLQLVENEEDFYHYLCDEIGIDCSKGYALTRSLRDCRLLLLIDEVEKMAGDGFTHEVRDRLRGLAEGRDAPFRLVMATCTPLDKLFEEGKTS
ncbi:MAG: AAA family ATPase, partial [Geitlerinemataceae cyanobacterium]